MQSKNPHLPAVYDALKQALLYAVQAGDLSEGAQRILDLLCQLQRVAGDTVHTAFTDLTSSEDNILRTKGKIDAIKAHRARTGSGLRESKEAVEAYMGKHSIYPPGGGY